jgi:hypothetical protein
MLHLGVTILILFAHHMFAASCVKFQFVLIQNTFQQDSARSFILPVTNDAHSFCAS